LIEIVIAVAIIAILAGSVAPLAYREVERAREQATWTELTLLRESLLEFYEDTGRLPSEAEGLPALITDPGATGWAGPYVESDTGDPSVEVTTDSWGNTYQYDLAPTTNPAAAAQALIASAGGDGILSMGSIGNTWILAVTSDDLHALVVSSPLERVMVRQAQQEMEALGDAGRRYFADHAAFPTGSVDVADTYLDPGLDGGAFVDPWHNSYQLTVDLSGAQPPDWVVRSFGPNRTDNGGAADDLTLNISSVPPARETTRYRLEIAQLILNQDPNLALTGNWALTDRAALNLAATFDTDGWGREYQLNVNSRLIFSMGSDGDASTTADNIPPGAGL
jgi:general secretion pathway protein G